MPKVSIITASYNYANYIGQTIESVINQTFSDWEMLVIDDGSNDNSIEIINEYVKKDSRVKLLLHENNENKGLINTIKLGTAEAKGEYVVFIESDDYITNDYIEIKMKHFNKNASIGLIYNKVHTFGYELSPKYYHWLNRIDNYWKKHNYPHNIHQVFALENFIPTFSCVMLKRDLLENLNWISPQPACFDYWLWIQVSKKCDIFYLPDELTYWRMHKDSYLNTVRKNPQQGFQFNKELLFGNRIRIKRPDYFIKFIYLKLLRLIFYGYLILKEKLSK